MVDPAGHGEPWEPLFVSTGAVAVAGIGDKTQIGAVAARFYNLLLVTAGTTLGMMLVDLPAVPCGEGIARLAPLKLIPYPGSGLVRHPRR
jgi:putative Ca2+/H+ antiporter (TMEM165/GDT1 family)